MDWLVGCLKQASGWAMTFLEQPQLIELLATQIGLHMNARRITFNFLSRKIVVVPPSTTWY